MRVVTANAFRFLSLSVGAFRGFHIQGVYREHRRCHALQRGDARRLGDELVRRVVSGAFLAASQLLLLHLLRVREGLLFTLLRRHDERPNRDNNRRG